jgi:pyridoxine kinase
MPTALILSSLVVAARIGGGAQQFVLARHGIDPLLVPTSMFGRSPAKGARGRVTEADTFARMLADIEADGLFAGIDLVITGHFSHPDQVEIAAATLRRVRAMAGDGPRPIVVTDPVLGDAPKGLYVSADVARGVAELLVPQADWITPNRWELDYLAKGEMVAAARSLGRPALVTSAAAGEGEIGLAYVDSGSATLFAHPRLPKAPNGTGDLVTASFAAGLVEGLAPVAAAERAARVASQAVMAAQGARGGDLPIVALADQLLAPTAPVRTQKL